jgi:DNA-binding transcriptional LysR family regulator
LIKNLGKSVTIRHVRAFIEVAEQGRFTAAADVLAISQPALTTTINQLEDLLEVLLFIRTTRNVQLTDIGKEFLPVAQNIVTSFDREIYAVYIAGKRSAGEVKIAVLPSLAISIIPRAIEQFSEAHLQIRVHVRDDNAKGVHQQILRNESDFGISNKWEEDGQLKFTPIFQDRVGLVCHKNHNLSKSRSGTQWHKLEKFSFVGMSADTGIYTLLNSIPDLPQCVSNPDYEVLTMVALASLIHSNLAVTALPALAVPRIVDPPLEFIKLGKPTVWRQIYLVTRKSSQLSASAELLRVFLQRALSKPWKLLSSEDWINEEDLRS